MRVGFGFCIEFQSTLPVWGGTLIGMGVLMVFQIFQSTLPVWGGTLGF